MMVGLLLLLLGLIVGFIVGFIFLAVAALETEKKYVNKGVAKIYGDYYKITPLEVKSDDKT